MSRPTVGRPTPERRRIRGACRSASRVPLLSRLRLLPIVTTKFDRSTVIVGGTRKCIPGFLVFPRALRRTAPQLPEITSLSLFLSPLRPLFLLLAFPLSSLRRFRYPASRALHPTPIFFPFPCTPLFSPLRSSYSSRLLLVSAARARFVAPAACRKPLSHSFPFPFTLVISLSRSRGYRPPVRYIKPLGDIFSRRP